MSAAQAYVQYSNRVNTVSFQKPHKTFSVKSIAGMIRDFFADPMFWDLYNAERSESMEEMNRFYAKYSR